MQEYNLIPNNSPSENPVVLIEKSSFFTLNGMKGCLRVVLLTADNRPVPYWLVQLYKDEDPNDTSFIMNTAMYPTRDVLEQINQGVLTSFDYIIGGLKMSHTKEIKMYRVDNGELYTEMLWNSFDILDKKISSLIDPVIITWLNNNPQ